MWSSKPDKKQGTARVETLIGRTTTIVGDVTFAGGLHVEGVIHGNVSATETASDAILILNEGARVEGDVHVPHLVVNGEIKGDVTATERVELAAKGKITGNLHYNLLEMAVGAEVNGNLVHHKPGSPQLEYRAVVESEPRALGHAGEPNS
ncbi:MAG: polymer-forming cytoskeletal protein [Chromatiales bacterium]|jgi:cytoskeletal protein CcmA (bactofilin family)|nr:polymer-forming cytoskeletal protein [Chromatiales bacterium]MDX9767185.1 polymer-forming cytoskeletal protein [Ectothiorhodospiraceae bacterium]